MLQLLSKGKLMVKTVLHSCRWQVFKITQEPLLETPVLLFMIRSKLFSKNFCHWNILYKLNLYKLFCILSSHWASYFNQLIQTKEAVEFHTSRALKPKLRMRETQVRRLWGSWRHFTNYSLLLNFGNNITIMAEGFKLSCSYQLFVSSLIPEPFLVLPWLLHKEQVA